MHKSMFDAIHAGAHGWWYAGRRSAVRALSRRAQCFPYGFGLDYGAGFGAMHSALYGCEAVDAFEIAPEALEVLRENGLYRNVFSNDAEVFAQPASYDTLGVFDVLEHIEEDASFLKRAHGLLREDGVLIGTVPAHPFLFGTHDELNMHFRRYAKAELVRKLTEAGFEIRAISYWNMTLFPASALLRLLGSKSGGLLSPHPLIDKMLTGIVIFETLLIRYLPLPMGLSLVFVARKISKLPAR